jgi:hypothetical protein
MSALSAEQIRSRPPPSGQLAQLAYNASLLRRYAADVLRGTFTALLLRVSSTSSERMTWAVAEAAGEVDVGERTVHSSSS